MDATTVDKDGVTLAVKAKVISTHVARQNLPESDIATSSAM
jgi:hypothetical protein